MDATQPQVVSQTPAASDAWGSSYPAPHIVLKKILIEEQDDAHDANRHTALLQLRRRREHCRLWFCRMVLLLVLTLFLGPLCASSLV